MYKLSAVACFLVLAAALVSCENAKEPKPSFICTASTPITFSNAIVSILNTNCTPGCHEPNGSFSSLPLTTAAEVETAIKNNNLINAINQNGQAKPMPPSLPKIAEDDIKKIECWQSQGFNP